MGLGRISPTSGTSFSLGVLMCCSRLTPFIEKGPLPFNRSNLIALYLSTHNPLSSTTSSTSQPTENLSSTCNRLSSTVLSPDFRLQSSLFKVS
ncbi:hypothetical protein LWI29_003967 [Acer saccharum]|uniref:Uncharacterized protein n=1 Tax=Acer saccharum TaxID=4024 RepID=A0AA39VN30_ACESA|nr:hypothetical protein LWI29_003967 [Acer saccharum]